MADRPTSTITRLAGLAYRGFPFFLAKPQTPIARLRALGARDAYRNRARPIRYLGCMAMTLGWPFGALVETVLSVRRLATEQDGLPLARIFLDMYRAALLSNVPPRGYRGYGLYRPDRRADLQQYLFTSDTPALSALNWRRGADQRDVQDKFRFATICAEQGLPHAPTLAAFHRGQARMPGGPFLPTIDRLFEKDLSGSQGSGAALWVRQGETYVCSDGRRAEIADLSSVLARRDCIVQPVLENHPALTPFTNGGLVVLRMITVADRAGAVEFIGGLASISDPDPGRPQARMVCAIDSRSGAVTQVIDLRRRGNERDQPASDKNLQGLVLPHWRQSVDLVTRAHAAFPRFATLGWDVVPTADGAVLLETNTGWATTHFQRLNGPLGAGRFGALLEGLLRDERL